MIRPYEGIRYWDIKTVDNWVFIFCPIMEDAVASKSFNIRRQLYVEFKKLEQIINQSKDYFKGWIAYTKLENPHIMKMYVKVGANPYKINIKEETIWFKKEII